MTANELLALLGRAWSRLLIYPGGLAAFGLLWLIGIFQNRRTGEPGKHPQKTIDGRRRTMRRRLSSIVYRLSSYSLGSSIPVALSSLVPPWLALALLPLPLAVALPRQIDMIIALALLEWPNLLAIRQALRAGNIRRLAAALNSYPALILAVLALAQASNSLEIAALARPLDSSATTAANMLHWLGAIALALALPPALAIGPFAEHKEPKNRRTEEPKTTNDDRRTTTDERRPTNDDRRTANDERRSTSPSPIPHPPSPIPHPQLGLRLRALGLVMLAALPWAGAEGTGTALLRLLGSAGLIAVLLWAYDRLTRGQAARRWAWAYLALDAALLLALLWAAYRALQSRLA